MSKKNRNQGFSLIEVVIAFGILMVVTTIVFGLMMTSSSTFSKTSADVDLQSEAQLAANSIKELLIDCQRSTEFFTPSNKLVDGSNEYENALLISNYDIQYLIYKDDPSNTLLFATRKRSDGSDPDAFTDVQFAYPEVLAKYVTDFNVDLSSLASDRVVRFDFTYGLRGKEYDGVYQVYLRNDEVVVDDRQEYEPVNKAKVNRVTIAPNPAYIVPSTDPNQIADPVQFNALVRVSGLSGQVDTSKKFKLTGTPDCFEIDELTGKLTTVAVPENNEYEVVAQATADPEGSNPGVARLLVKKVNHITIQALSGTTGGTGGGVQYAARNSRVLFAATVDGYNLTSADRGVTWALEYRPNDTTGYSLISYYDGSTGRYVSLRPDLAEINASGVMTIGENVTNSFSFRITAQAQFPNYKENIGDPVTYMTDSCELNIHNEDINFNGAFVRGFNIDLKSYYMSGKANEDLAIDADVTEMRGFRNVTGEFGTVSPDLQQLRNNSILYLNLDNFSYENQAQTRQYFKEQHLYVDFLDQENHTRQMTITLPEVSITKALPVENYIILRKGATKDVTFSYTGMNITDASQIGIYIDDQKVNASGTSSVNPNISAYVRTTTDAGKNAFGTKDSYVSSQSVRIAASATRNSYPISSIPFRIALEDYYQVTGGTSAGTDVHSYFECPVYIANVEGQELYIPGPSAAGYPSSVSTTGKVFNLGPAGTPVTLYLTSTNKVRMYYSSTTYEYNTANKYWRKVS